MKKVVLSIAMWAFIVFVPAHVSFAYSMYPQYRTDTYQLYWCGEQAQGGGYYSYSPCPSSYTYPSYTYPTYTYPSYAYSPSAYPSYYYYPSLGYSFNTNVNMNANYNYNGYGYYGGYLWY